MKNTFVYAFSIIIAGALIAGAIFFSGGRTSSQPVGTASPEVVTEKDVPLDIAADDPVLGNPNAPVTIVAFADFQCPYCGKWATETGSKLIDKYVKTGKAKMIFKTFSFLGDESVWAGEAVECAKEQDKFWEMHDYLFSHQKGENQGSFSKDNLKKFAAALKLDTAKFNECLDSDKYKDKIENSGKDNAKYGIISTPSAIIGKLPITVPGSVIQSLKSQERTFNYDLTNGKLIIGAQPYETFETAVEDMLK